MKTVERNLYTIGELKEKFPKVYASVIEKNRNFYTGDRWFDDVYTDVCTMLNSCGFQDVNIQFSGFWSQGDGASFTARFDSETIDIDALKSYAPNEVNYIRIAEFFKEKCLPYGNVTFNLERTQYRHYVHANTITLESMECDPESDTVWDNLRGDFIMQARSIMREIYARLENEYTEITSDSAIEESLESNECYFDENGRPE